MPVEIKIWHENAKDTLSELAALTAGLRPAAGASGVAGLASTATAETVAVAATQQAVAEKAEAPKERKPRGSSKKNDEPQIRANPEDRRDPAEAAQDAEDEKAEVQESAGDEQKLTVDDVRAAAGGYIKKFGMENAQADLIPCLQAATGFAKMSELPDDQAVLKKAIDALLAASAADKRYGQ